MTAYNSKELFHFVGHARPDNHESNYDVLTKIISSQCVSYPPHENGWGTVSLTTYPDQSLLSEKLIVPNITCYADIPFNSLRIHVSKYGKFGLSFLRSYLIQYGARPVMYVPITDNDWASPHGKTLLSDLESIYKAFGKYVVSKHSSASVNLARTLGKEPSNEFDAIHALNNIFAKDFLAFIKPFNAQLQDDDPDNFYMEREWRKFGNLRFCSEDIQRVIVSEGYAKRLAVDFPQFEGKVYEV